MAASPDRFRYLDYLKNCLRRRGRTREDAEDLVQEAFVRLELYCCEGHEVAEPEAFLMRTALNLSVSHHRHESSSPFSKKPIETLNIVDFSTAPDEVFAAEERLERVRQILDAIGIRTREIFFMHRLGGFSYAEISDRIGISISAIEKHIARAAAALALERQGNGR